MLPVQCSLGLVSLLEQTSLVPALLPLYLVRGLPRNLCSGHSVFSLFLFSLKRHLLSSVTFTNLSVFPHFISKCKQETQSAPALPASQLEQTKLFSHPGRQLEALIGIRNALGVIYSHSVSLLTVPQSNATFPSSLV